MIRLSHFTATVKGKDSGPIDWLRRTVEMFEWRLHAFVLLDSHDNLFVETPEDAKKGLLSGSTEFVARVRRMLGERREDPDVPQLRQLRPRPALETIKLEVAVGFGVAPGNWSPGRRSDDAGRAVAAYLARRRFGYSAAAVAIALGYRDHGGVGQAIRRVEHGTAALQRTVKRLEQKLLNAYRPDPKCSP